MAVAIALLAVSLVLFSMVRERVADQSQALFVTLSLLGFAYSLLSGVLTTADCISEEKREGTLGLLFLTDLRGYDVIAGKGLASSLRAVSALVALLPLTAIPLLMGGVEARTIGVSSAVLLNTLFLSLAIGVFASVLWRDARQAVGATIFLLAFLVVLLPIFRSLILEYSTRSSPGVIAFAGSGVPTRERLLWVLAINPAVLLVTSWNLRGLGSVLPIHFWQALAIQHALAWGFILLAAIILPRIWQDRAEGRRAVLPGSTREARKRSRGHLLDQDPFAWLILRERRPVVALWTGLVVIAGVWVWGYWELKEEWLDPFVTLVTLFFGGIWVKSSLSSAACRVLHEQRRSGALELVLCTPTTPTMLANGAALGLRRFIAAPTLTLLVAAGLLLMFAVRSPRGSSDLGDALAMGFAGSLVLLLDLWTIQWTGLWQGVSSPRFTRAQGLTQMLVMALPWTIFFVSLIVVGILVETLELGLGYEPSFALILTWWTVLSVAVDVWLLVRCRRLLGSRLRELAADSHGGTSRPKAVPAQPAVG